MASGRGDEFCDELQAARKGRSQVWGKSADPISFTFSRHVTHVAENSVGSSARLFSA